MWIGLQDFLQEGTFSWADGTALGSYTSWLSGQPDNAGGNQVTNIEAAFTFIENTYKVFFLPPNLRLKDWVLIQVCQNLILVVAFPLELFFGVKLLLIQKSF